MLGELDSDRGGSGKGRVGASAKEGVGDSGRFEFAVELNAGPVGDAIFRILDLDEFRWTRSCNDPDPTGAALFMTSITL